VLALAIAALALAVSPAQPRPTDPFHVTAEPRGTLLVADGSSGRVLRIDPRTGRRTVFAGRLGRVYDVELGPDGVYVSTATKVIRFAGGRRRTVASGLHDPIGIAVAQDGTLYVAEATATRVVRFDGGTRTVVASDGLDQPLGLAFDESGALLVADSRRGRVVRVGDGGTLEPVLEGLGLPVGLTAAPDGTVLVADHVSHTSKGRILRLHADGTTDVVSAGKIRALSGVAATRGGVLYACSFVAPFVGRVDAKGRLVPIEPAK